MNHETLLRRLEVADAAIEMLNSGKLPNVKKLLFGARCEVREIIDPDSFWSTQSTDAELAEQLNASERVGIVRSMPDNPGRFHVFFDGKLCEQHQAFLGKNVAVIYGRDLLRHRTGYIDHGGGEV